MMENKRLDKVQYDEMKGTYNGKELDMDRYEVDISGPMSTQQWTVVVNHKDKNISGDAVRYGSWDTLTEEECLEVLVLLEEKGELKRPYKEYIEKKENVNMEFKEIKSKGTKNHFIFKSDEPVTLEAIQTDSGHLVVYAYKGTEELDEHSEPETVFDSDAEPKCYSEDKNEEEND
jgi:hypothetical protein